MDFAAIANRMIPRPDRNEVLLKANGTTADIMAQVMDTYQVSKKQLLSLAPHLRTATLENTCRVIWQLVKNNIAYKEDPPGKQWVKTPARLWADRLGDCKSYSIFIASALYSLGIDFSFRFVSFTADPTPTHVYIVVKRGGRVIKIDAVLNEFNKEKAYKHKHDYSMKTAIYQMSGVKAPRVQGLLQDVVLGKKRQAVLQQALPGLAILALYQWIPAGTNPTPDYPQLRTLLASNDDLLKYAPPEVLRKRALSLQSFWDFGAWANVKVETDVFPQMRQHLTSLLGKDPQAWWREQFKGNNIGVIPIPPQAITAALGFLKTLIGKVGGLLGGTDITWKRGDPSVWGPAIDDWKTFARNPLGSLNLGITASGQFVKQDYLSMLPIESGMTTGGGSTYYPASNVDTIPQGTYYPQATAAGGMDVKTIGLVALGGLALFMFMKKK